MGEFYIKAAQTGGSGRPPSQLSNKQADTSSARNGSAEKDALSRSADSTQYETPGTALNLKQETSDGSP